MARRPCKRPALIKICGPWQIAATGLLRAKKLRAISSAFGSFLTNAGAAPPGQDQDCIVVRDDLAKGLVYGHFVAVLALGGPMAQGAHCHLNARLLQPAVRNQQLRVLKIVRTYNQGFHVSSVFVARLFLPSAYFGISCCRRCGSSPSHSGFWAVPSNMDVVLNGSKSPRAAASAVFDSKDRTSSSLIGRNVRTASHA